MRRRYRDFEWLKKELERDSKVNSIIYGFVYSVLGLVPRPLQEEEGLGTRLQCSM